MYTYAIDSKDSYDDEQCSKYQDRHFCIHKKINSRIGILIFRFNTTDMKEAAGYYYLLLPSVLIPIYARPNASAASL